VHTPYVRPANWAPVDTPRGKCRFCSLACYFWLRWLTTYDWTLPCLPRSIALSPRHRSAQLHTIRLRCRQRGWSQKIVPCWHHYQAVDSISHLVSLESQGEGNLRRQVRAADFAVGIHRMVGCQKTLRKNRKESKESEKMNPCTCLLKMCKSMNRGPLTKHDFQMVRSRIHSKDTDVVGTIFIVGDSSW